MQSLLARERLHGTKTCSSATDGGFVVPPGCDLTKAPKDSTECFTDAVGVFVSPAGSSAADGTKIAPVKSIADGVALAARRGLPRVYVCEGAFDGNVEVKQPVTIVGGLTCAWAVADVKPKLAPASGVALRVTKVSGAVLVEVSRSSAARTRESPATRPSPCS